MCRGHAVSIDNLHGHSPIASQYWEPVGDLANTAEDISGTAARHNRPSSGSDREAGVVRPSRDGQEAHARHRCWRDAGAGIQRDNFSRPAGATAARRPQALSGAYRHPFCAVAPILAGWYLMLLPNSGPGMATISPPVWSAIQHSYDTAKECERARAKARIPRQSSPFGRTDLAFYCIATDDPRLR